MTHAIHALAAELGINLEIASDATSLDLRAVHGGEVLAAVAVVRVVGFDAAEAKDAASDLLVVELVRLASLAALSARYRVRPS